MNQYSRTTRASSARKPSPTNKPCTPLSNNKYMINNNPWQNKYQNLKNFGDLGAKNTQIICELLDQTRTQTPAEGNKRNKLQQYQQSNRVLNNKQQQMEYQDTYKIQHEEFVKNIKIFEELKYKIQSMTDIYIQQQQQQQDEQYIKQYQQQQQQISSRNSIVQYYMEIIQQYCCEQQQEQNKQKFQEFLEHIMYIQNILMQECIKLNRVDLATLVDLVTKITIIYSEDLFCGLLLEKDLVNKNSVNHMNSQSKLLENKQHEFEQFIEVVIHHGKQNQFELNYLLNKLLIENQKLKHYLLMQNTTINDLTLTLFAYEANNEIINPEKKIKLSVLTDDISNNY